jgi:hypothetical protein
MIERSLLVAAATGAIASLVAWRWDARAAIGVMTGAAWNLASLWCLARLLAAWLGPRSSRRRAVGWLLVKFPLLYLLIVLLVRSPAVSVVAFGVGFSVVLVSALIGVALYPHTQRAGVGVAHGR